MNSFHTSTLIKELRTNYKYTIQKVANLLGVSKAAVSKWENGDDITTEHLYDLAKLYNVTFSELYNGKLSGEENSDYWRRNYDLSNFELSEDINNKNIDKLKNLFEHCLMVKRRFFELLPKWGKDELLRNELEEFKFIKKYFKFDSAYYAYVKFGPGHIVYASERDEKEFTKEEISRMSSLNEKQYNWELAKLYNFTYDYKSDDVCRSGNLKALEHMLTFFSQIEKDSILYANLHVEEDKEVEFPFGTKSIQKVNRDRKDHEIENIPFFRVIINAGAHVLHQYKSFSNGWDREMFDKIEGKTVQLDDTVYHKYQIYNFGGETLVPVLNNWKLFTYDDYLEFIDEKETSRLNDIVNLKDANPLKYYENMVMRDNVDFEKKQKA